MFGRDAFAPIGDREPDHVPLIGMGTNGHGSPRRAIFERIADEIVQELAELCPVPPHMRQLRIDFCHDILRTLILALTENLHDLLDQRHERDGLVW